MPPPVSSRAQNTSALPLHPDVAGRYSVARLLAAPWLTASPAAPAPGKWGQNA